MKGAELEHLRFEHPLYTRDSVGVLAEYVTLEQGTGAVHTAPGHGSDDFATGVKYGLEIYAPVGPGGHFLDTVELFNGQRVFDANPVIVKALEARGRLWHHEAFQHSYPHCWRCHNPVIFLATSQWFIRMDGAARRLPAPACAPRALEAVDHEVDWLPAWGRERLSNMIANRPDWCISRQRAWGVPIPAVDCTKCGEAILTPALVERAAGVFDVARRRRLVRAADRRVHPRWPDVPVVRRHRVRARARHPRRLVRLGLEPRGGAAVPPRADVAGRPLPRRQRSASRLVPELAARRPRHARPRPVQRRSSRTASSSTKTARRCRSRSATRSCRRTSSRRAAPRSSGSGSRWSTTARKCGSASRSSRASSRPTARSGTRCGTWRRTSTTSIRSIACRSTRWRKSIATRSRATPRPRATVVEAYARYDYPTIFQTINQFTTVDLSAFYADVSKDRLYTFGAASPERRSAQTAMYTIADGLVRLLAPILPVTTDELWRHLPGNTRGVGPHGRVPAGRRPRRACATTALRAALGRAARRAVGGQRPARGAAREEGDRQLAAGERGHRRQRRRRPPRLLKRYADALPMLFIVSEVTLGPRAAARPSPGGRRGRGTGRRVEPRTWTIEAAPAQGEKCPRCWRIVPDGLVGRRQPRAVRALRGRDDGRTGRGMMPDQSPSASPSSAGQLRPMRRRRQPAPDGSAAAASQRRAPTRGRPS